MKLIEDILPINYYYEMTGIITDTKIIIRLIKKYFPELEKIIDTELMTIKNFINKWLITIFTNDFQKELGYLIWDYLLLQGNIILFKSVFAIFSILKKRLLTQKNKEECLYPIFSDTLDIDPRNKNLLFGLAIKNYDINENYITKKRNAINPAVFDKIKKINKNSYERKIKSKNVITKKCDEKWPICLGNDKMRSNPINRLNFIVFKMPNNTKYYKDYFYDEINNNNINNIHNNEDNNIYNNKQKLGNKNEENKFNDTFNIITEREQHICCCLSGNNKSIKENN